MIPKKSFFPVFVYIASLVVLIVAGGWSLSVSISYLGKRPMDGTLFGYGLLHCGILALVALMQWLVLRPQNLTFIFVSDVAFWLAGMPGYVFFWAWALGINPLAVALNVIGFAILFFAAIRTAGEADPFGFIAKQRSLAATQKTNDRLARERH